MADTTQQQGLQFPTFYKPDPNNPQVYDSTGKAIDLQAYKQATGQLDVPDNKLNWQFVQNAPVPPQIDSSSIWSLPGMAALKTQLSPADQAFSEALYKVTQGQIDAGGVGTIDSGSYNKALQIASEDPAIKATYGDAAKIAAQDLAFSIGQITNNQATAQPALQVQLQQQQKALQDQIASTGQAYSGFRKQAEDQLKTQQADVIQSSRSQLQQQLQTLGRGYESQFGSSGLPQISVGGPVTGTQTYQPVGNVTGTQTYGQQQASQQTAQDLGVLPKVSSTGVLK